jgi:hypothetical protein
VKSYLQPELEPKKTPRGKSKPVPPHFFKEARHESFDPELMTEGLAECGVRGIFWSLEFGYCPSTGLRVVSLSNHLLFVIWSLEFFIFEDPNIV